MSDRDQPLDFDLMLCPLRQIWIHPCTLHHMDPACEEIFLVNSQTWVQVYRN